MESATPSFSCYLIGDESLLIRCADVLLSKGHDVRGILTTDDQIAAWAEGEGVPVTDPATPYYAALSRAPFDYFFSVAHLRLIPEEVLRLARRAAINFHDGPLPDYAGLNTPNWAILNGEEVPKRPNGVMRKLSMTRTWPPPTEPLGA